MIVAIALLVAGFAMAAVPGTVALPVLAAGHPSQPTTSEGCSGFVLSGAVSGCLAISSITCSPAGTIDPVTGLRVARDRIRIAARGAGFQAVEMVMTPASTSITLARGGDAVRLNGGAAARFSVAGGVHSDQDLSELLTAATVHLTGAAGCF